MCGACIMCACVVAQYGDGPYNEVRVYVTKNKGPLLRVAVIGVVGNFNFVVGARDLRLCAQHGGRTRCSVGWQCAVRDACTRKKTLALRCASSPSMLDAAARSDALHGRYSAEEASISEGPTGSSRNRGRAYTYGWRAGGSPPSSVAALAPMSARTPTSRRISPWSRRRL